MNRTFSLSKFHEKAKERMKHLSSKVDSVVFTFNVNHRKCFLVGFKIGPAKTMIYRQLTGEYVCTIKCDVTEMKEYYGFQFKNAIFIRLEKSLIRLMEKELYDLYMELESEIQEIINCGDEHNYHACAFCTDIYCINHPEYGGKAH